jgi:hypothetical protein
MHTYYLFPSAAAAVLMLPVAVSVPIGAGAVGAACAARLPTLAVVDERHLAEGVLTDGAA